MYIEGKWHFKGSAAYTKATLRIIDKKEYILELDNGTLFSGALSSLSVSDRLGNIERKITLEDDSVFATLQNDSVDKIFKERFKSNHFIHILESKFRWALIALVISILSLFAFFKWGVPWSSQRIAHALPEKTNQLISENTLAFLDKFLFEKTQLDTVQMANIRTHFRNKIIPLASKHKEIHYTLHFRDWSDNNLSIPNALALSSGDIIVTDKFVQLYKTQAEIDAVLLHEMGHVVHRHTLEMLIEGTFVSLVVMLLTGDNNGLADMGVGLGSVLVSSAYSRDHESEADMYAFNHMLKARIDPASFFHIMDRITVYIEKKIDPKYQHKTSEDRVLDYFSSHPNTAIRIEIANQFSNCYKKGLSTCEIRIKEE